MVKVSDTSGAGRVTVGPPVPATSPPGLPVSAGSSAYGEGADGPAGRTDEGIVWVLTAYGETHRFVIGETANLVYIDAEGVTIWDPSYRSRTWPWRDIDAISKSGPEQQVDPRDPRIAEHVDSIGRGVKA